MKKLTFLLLLVLMGCILIPPTDVVPTTKGAETPGATLVLLETSVPDYIPEATNTPVNEPISTAAFAPTATNTPAVLSGAGTIITPTLRMFCPAEPEVQIDELGIPANYGLALVDSTAFLGSSSYPLYVFFSGHAWSAPEILIENGNSYGFSPDQRWIVYHRPGEYENQELLWIISSEGEQQMPAMPEPVFGGPVWVNEDQIVLVGPPFEYYDPRKDYYKIRPLSAVNLLAQESQSLEIVNLNYRFYDDLLMLNGNLYGIFYQGWISDRFYLSLYDYSRNTEHQAFRWLREPWLPEATEEYWNYDPHVELRPGGFLVAVHMLDGMDLAIDLDLEVVLSNNAYSEMMTHVVIPEHLREFSLKSVARARNWFAFSQYNLDSTDDRADLFFILDYDKQEIREYCYSDQTISSLHFSPDGRFAAFNTSYIDKSRNKVRRVVFVMDLDSGYYARIPEFFVDGWLIRE
jgi:hypothetical protein